MNIWFHATRWNWKIEALDVTQETDKTVMVISRFGGRPFRQLKESDDACFKPTLAAAIEWLLPKALRESDQLWAKQIKIKRAIAKMQAGEPS